MKSRSAKEGTANRRNFLPIALSLNLSSKPKCMSKYINLERILWLVALCFIASFATIRVIGLAPDAALYAGLANKVFMTGEYWLLRGTDGFFPKFYEHPPYFFQWGSWLMGMFGASDMTAKLMGAIPTFIALLILATFTFKNWGWKLAAWTIFIVATTGHYTKYAATSLLEAPLALFTLMALISTYYFHKAEKNYWRLLAMLGLFLSVAGACASKGVVGLGCVGGALLSYALIILVKNRSLFEFVRLWFLGVFLVFAAALPFLLWLLKSFQSPELASWVLGYFEEQVLRSATTNRGEEFFHEADNYFYYLGVLARNLWPWIWTVPVGVWFALKTRSDITIPKGFRLYMLVAFSFFIAFLVPLSLVSYKLPHYMHPTYLLLAPVGGWGMLVLFDKLIQRFPVVSEASIPFRWLFLFAAFYLTLGQGARLSSTQNRGQEFYELGLKTNELNSACTIWIPESQTAPYRMEAFSLWYLGGRAWKRIENDYPSRITIPKDVIYWDPSKSILWNGEDCI